MRLRRRSLKDEEAALFQPLADLTRDQGQTPLRAYCDSMRSSNGRVTPSQE